MRAVEFSEQSSVNLFIPQCCIAVALKKAASFLTSTLKSPLVSQSCYCTDKIDDCLAVDILIIVTLDWSSSFRYYSPEGIKISQILNDSYINKGGDVFMYRISAALPK